MGLASEAPKFSDLEGAGFRGDQVTCCIRRVIAAAAILIGIRFEDVFGACGIVLERGKRIN